jgi:hypothetical protein
MAMLNDFENSIKAKFEGKTLFVMVTSVSASGMSRTMRVFTTHRANDIVEVTASIANVLELPLSKNGVRIRGCGMDMVFWLIDCLKTKLEIPIDYRYL